jgi:hypothetical protein
MTEGVRYLAFRLTPPTAGLTAMVALALLYHLKPQYYYSGLAFIGIATVRYPFIDFQNILAAVDCWQHGMDVYFNDPCDINNSPFNYSPLWLRFSFLPGKEWTNPLGLCLAISFFLALAVLPTPRSAKELLTRLIATLSPVTAFAVERGNIDLLLFVMATAAGVLLLGPLRRRVAAYAMIVIAGLLKFYPLVLMVLTLRERPRVFLWVNGAATVVVLSMFLYFRAEVAKLDIESAWAVGDFFGAHILPDRIAWMAGPATHPRLSILARLLTFAALCLGTAGWFLHMVRWRDFRIALAQLPDREKIFLLIGAALIAGCFFTGSSAGYRAIYLLFTLPGLLAMARMEGDTGVRRVAVQGCVLVVALTWVGFVTWHGPFRHYVPWLLSQIAWWQVAALFVAILIGCCFDWFTAMPERRRLVGRAEVAQARAK